MKYRLVKKYPGSPGLGYETEFNNNGEDWNTPNMLIVADCKDFPEFWEEVKEPLFVTDIEQNKPKFSVKDVEEALLFAKEEKHSIIEDEGFIILSKFNEKKFKQKLGI